MASCGLQLDSAGEQGLSGKKALWPELVLRTAAVTVERPWSPARGARQGDGESGRDVK